MSLDVTSLFTNIPQKLVTKSIEKRYQYITNENIPLLEIIDACKFIMNNTIVTFFQFDGKYYQQIYGSPMGSPISPLFADTVMVDLEEEYSVTYM